MVRVLRSPGYLENAEEVGSQPVVVPTTPEQFDLTFAFSEDPERLGLGVMRHANTEFEYIVRFLTVALLRGEPRTRRRPNAAVEEGKCPPSTKPPIPVT
jgi:hypothetical protein